MFQQFFEDTLMSRYIKGMLSHEKIPMLSLVSSGDDILQGCQYIYKDWIILCEKSGQMLIDGDDNGEISSTFYPGLTYPSPSLFPKLGISVATFKIISRYNDESDVAYSFMSDCNYYDPDTHYHLGQYLRYLKYSKGIDLMPYYNCFNNKSISDITLTSTPPYYEIRSNKEFKVLAVPIQFNRTYTIAIESSSTVRCRCVLYGRSGLLLDSDDETSQTYLDDLPTMRDSYKEYSRASFYKPFTYRINCDESKLANVQRCLHLLIQVPTSNTSSIVVLEGKFTDCRMNPRIDNKKVITSEKDIPTGEGASVYRIISNNTDADTSTNSIHNYYRNLSLLYANCNKSFAFSSRLIEYLLGNVITCREEIPNNIYKVQDAIDKIDRIYHDVVDSEKPMIDAGVWDDYLTDSLKRLISNDCERHSDSSKIKFPFAFDLDENVTKDVEKLFVDETGGY